MRVRILLLLLAAALLWAGIVGWGRTEQVRAAGDGEADAYVVEEHRQVLHPAVTAVALAGLGAVFLVCERRATSRRNG